MLIQFSISISNLKSEARTKCPVVFCVHNIPGWSVLQSTNGESNEIIQKPHLSTRRTIHLDQGSLVKRRRYFTQQQHRIWQQLLYTCVVLCYELETLPKDERTKTEKGRVRALRGETSPRTASGFYCASRLVQAFCCLHELRRHALCSYK
jgi:hypothetical protein